MSRLRPQASCEANAEHFVSVRTDVLSDVEHALGNLFQRIHHITRVSRDGLGPYADRLTDVVQDLEQLLELVFDYVSPIDLQIRPVKCSWVAESLAAQFRAQGSLEVSVDEVPTVEVLGDLRGLPRSFGLAASALSRDLDAGRPVRIHAAYDERQHRCEITARFPSPHPSPMPANAGLAWEVAGRLIDLQGGELCRSHQAGFLSCTVILPANGR